MMSRLIYSALLPAMIASAAPARRKYVCKSPSPVLECYWTHGRLGFTNGTPSLRLWKIGTTRILGIYSGPEAYLGDQSGENLDNENPQLPTNIGAKLKAFHNEIYADFEICPLEPEKPQTMQPACIMAARNIVVEDFSK